MRNRYGSEQELVEISENDLLDRVRRPFFKRKKFLLISETA
jgi:hypothetical protein